MGLKAGFGSCEVALTPEVLPPSRENYIGIHDRPSVKVMLLQGEESFALVNVGLVMGERGLFLDAAEEILGIKRENIVVHFQHILSTPHYEAKESPEIHTLYLNALRTAARQAAERLVPALIGIGSAVADVTVNRMVRTKNGWWQGINPDGPVDHTVPIIRVDREDGSPMGLVFTVNAAPGCLEFSSLPEGRLVSADLAGASERFLEEQLGGGLVAMYCTGATGDQWTRLRARLDYLTPDGEQIIRDLGGAGFALVDVLGTRLGERVMQKALSVETATVEELSVTGATFRYPHQEVRGASPALPALRCEYVVDGEEALGAKALHLGNAAIVFCGVELNVSFLKQLREASPCTNTWLVEFSEKGGGYLPPADDYDRITYQSLKCRYAQGSEERYLKDLTELIQDSHP